MTPDQRLPKKRPPGRALPPPKSQRVPVSSPPALVLLKRVLPLLFVTSVAAVFLLSSGLFSAGEDKKDDERARQVYNLAQIIEITPEAKGKPAKVGTPEAVLREYSKLGQMTSEGMKTLYRAAGGDANAFKIVKMLIANRDGSGGGDPSLIQNKDGITKFKISYEDSVEMAKLRDRWIETVIQEVLKTKSPPWRVSRSDSGNVTSGMRSDLDQTFFVEVWDPKEGWKRAPELDAKFIQEFNKTWDNFPGLKGVSRGAVDIASMEGRDRFPDPRDTTINFEKEFKRVTEALRSTPGAYTYQGATVQQMQFRALGEILRGNERAFQSYELDPKTKQIKKLPLDPDAALRTIFGIEPKLMPAFAFGAALANFVEISKKMDVKYHLRPVEDAALPLLMPEKTREKKIELTELGGNDKEAFKKALDDVTKQVVESVFTDPKKRTLHKAALEVSTYLRLMHKNESGKIPLSLPADKAKQEEKIFGVLAEQMFPDFNPQKPDPEQIKAAQAEHKKLAKEFALETVYRASAEAFRVYQDARYKNLFDMDGYRHLMSGVAPEDWPKVSKNLGQAAHITFLYGIYDLGFTESIELMKRLNQQFSGEWGIKFDLLYLWARGRGLKDIVGPPAAVAERLNEVLSDQVTKLDAYLRDKAPLLHEKVQEHVLTQIGFEKVKPAAEVNRVLTDYKLRWSPGKLAQGMAYDPGNVDALAQILRTYVETKGDMARVKAAIADEIIMAIPVAGQVVSASRADIPGLVFMAGAMAFPMTVGVGLLVYSVGEAGYAIYDMEYRRQHVTNIEDAIYRGFAGPTTRAYDGVPPQFTDNDQKELDRLQAQLAEAEKDQSGYEKVKNQLSPKIKELEMRRDAFEQFRDESAYGGYFTEWGAIKEQKPFGNYLLKDVPPVISFSPSGIVDFRAEHDPKTDEDRIKKLEQEIPGLKDAEAVLRKTAELKELTLQKSRYERAERYLAKATGRSGDATNMTAQEAKAGVPELMFKIQRDSLYPGMLALALGERAQAFEEKRKEMSDDEAFQAVAGIQPNTDTFLDKWFERYSESAARELVGLGVLSDTVNPKTGITTRARLPGESLENLKTRLYADYVRSKVMYQEYMERERKRKETEKILLEQRLAAYRGQSAGLLVEAIDQDPDMKDMKELVEAMRWSAVKRNAPVIKADVYLIHEPDPNAGKPQTAPKPGAGGSPGGQQQPGAAQAGSAPEDKVRMQVHVQVTADPNLYRPPYRWDVVVLSKKQAEQALSSGATSVNGIPLLPETKEALRSVLEDKLKNAGKDPAKSVMIPLISVYASDMPDLSKAIPETVRHLPGVNLGPQRTETGALQNNNLLGFLPFPGSGYAEAAEASSASPSSQPRYIMGQTVAYGEVGVKPQAEVELKVSYSIRPNLLEFVAQLDDKTPVDPDAYYPPGQKIPSIFPFYEDFDDKNARSFPDYWGDERVEKLEGQVWVLWPEAPTGGSFLAELTVKGGSPPYENIVSRMVYPVAEFPKTEQQKEQLAKAKAGGAGAGASAGTGSSGGGTGGGAPPGTGGGKQPADQKTGTTQAPRPLNAFMIPFPWPTGNAGSFEVKGRILAYDKPSYEVSDPEKRKQLKPVEVFEIDQSFSIKDERLPDQTAFLNQITLRKTVPPKEGDAGKSQTPSYTYVTFYENYDESKASSWGNRWGKWGGQDLYSMSPQFWVRRKDAPVNKTYFYFEGKLLGGFPQYDKDVSASWVLRNAEFPKLGEPDPFPAPGPSQQPAPPQQPQTPKYRDEVLRNNVFVIRFPWPKGHEGKFTLKGNLLAFDKQYQDDSWKKAKPLAKYPIEQTFSIPEERLETDVRVRLKYAQALPAGTAPPEKYDEWGKLLSEATSFSYSKDPRYIAAYLDFDETQATPFWYYFDPATKNRGGNPQLWVSWKDMPPDKQIYVDLTVSGGTPLFERKVKRSLNGLKGFPPYDTKPQPGNSFVIDLAYPDKSGGRFAVTGSIYAATNEYSEEQKKYVEKRWAELPIQTAFSLRKSAMTISGSVTLSPSGISGSASFSNIQQGRRMVEISAAGKTVYGLLSGGSVSFSLPVYVDALESVTFSFKDFGERVTVAAPLKTYKQSFTPVDPQRVKRTQEELDRALKEGNLATVGYKYTELAQWHQVGAWRDALPDDYGQWKSLMAQGASFYRQDAARLEGGPQPDGANDKKYLAQRVVYNKRSAAGITWRIAEMALTAGDLAEAQAMFAQAEAELLQTGDDPKSIRSELVRRYILLANKTLLLSGDPKAAHAVWLQYVEQLKLAGLTEQQLPKESPFTVDPGFEEKTDNAGGSAQGK